MMTRSLFLITAGVLALGLAASPAAAQPSFRRIDVPPVPANLEVPAGHVVFLEGQAVGTQNYICMPAATGVAWKFLGPQATLFLSKHGNLEQQIATHFLSANPAENGTARPTWQHSLRQQPGVGTRQGLVNRSELRRARRHSLVAARSSRHRTRAGRRLAARGDDVHSAAEHVRRCCAGHRVQPVDRDRRGRPGAVHHRLLLLSGPPSFLIDAAQRLIHQGELQQWLPMPPSNHTTSAPRPSGAPAATTTTRSAAASPTRSSTAC